MNNFRFVLFLTLLFLTILNSLAFASDVLICPTVMLSDSLPNDLSDLEKKLVCGSSDKTTAWHIIPQWQAESFLIPFLQQRGYQEPQFENRDNHILYVRLGAKTLINKIKTVNLPPEIDISKKREIISSTLTPARLDTLEDWTQHEMSQHGYACPIISTTADAHSGLVIIKAENSSIGIIKSVEEVATPDLPFGIVRRYDAFQMNDVYDSHLMTLTERRAVKDTALQSVNFTPKCDQSDVHVSQDIMIGPPRLLSVGFGANTEEGGILRVKWRNSRLGSMASSFQVEGYTSFRTQYLLTNYNWYFLPYVSRLHLQPDFELNHQFRPKFDLYTLTTRLLMATSFDTGGINAQFTLGPIYESINTKRGNGPPHSKNVALDFETDLMSHDYEYYLQDPRKGFQLTLKTRWSSKEVLSDFSAEKFDLNGHYLVNFNNFDPPLFVLAMRGGLSTTFTNQEQSGENLLPVSYQQTLGGSFNIRGFSLNELPLGLDSSRLSSAYLSAELRLVEELPYGIQPIIFYDGGFLGRKALSLDHPYFYSPGLGTRWDSPIGIFRATLAWGYAETFSHSQLYLSYGEEF